MFGNPLLTNASGTWLLGTPPTMAANPVNQMVMAGGTANFTAVANGYPASHVQWDVSTDGGTTFSPTPVRPRRPTASRPMPRKTATSTRPSSPTVVRQRTTAASLTVDYARAYHEPEQSDGRGGRHGELHGGGQRQSGSHRAVGREQQRRDDLQPRLRSDRDDLQLHGQRRGKRLPVRGRVHQQRRFGDHHGGHIDRYFGGHRCHLELGRR